jgi:hypothetical protein
VRSPARAPWASVSSDLRISPSTCPKQSPSQSPRPSPAHDHDRHPYPPSPAAGEPIAAPTRSPPLDSPSRRCCISTTRRTPPASGDSNQSAPDARPHAPRHADIGRALRPLLRREDTAVVEGNGVAEVCLAQLGRERADSIRDDARPRVMRSAARSSIRPPRSNWFGLPPRGSRRSGSVAAPRGSGFARR